MSKIKIGDCVALTRHQNELYLNRLFIVHDVNVTCTVIKNFMGVIYASREQLHKIQKDDKVRILVDWWYFKNHLDTSASLSCERAMIAGNSIGTIHNIRKNEVSFKGQDIVTIRTSNLKYISSVQTCTCSVITLHSIGCQCGVIVG